MRYAPVKLYYMPVGDLFVNCDRALRSCSSALRVYHVQDHSVDSTGPVLRAGLFRPDPTSVKKVASQLVLLSGPFRPTQLRVNSTHVVLLCFAWVLCVGPFRLTQQHM